MQTPARTQTGVITETIRGIVDRVNAMTFRSWICHTPSQSTSHKAASLGRWLSRCSPSILRCCFEILFIRVWQELENSQF